MNKVILRGRLIKDIELRQATTPVAKFTLAVNRKFKKDESDFINCIAFGKTAETLEAYTSKGSELLLEGRIQTGSYENKQGQKVYTTDVVIESFEFIANKNKDSEVDHSKDALIDDGDIPF